MSLPQFFCCPPKGHPTPSLPNKGHLPPHSLCSPKAISYPLPILHHLPLLSILRPKWRQDIAHPYVRALTVSCWTLPRGSLLHSANSYGTTREMFVPFTVAPTGQARMAVCCFYRSMRLTLQYDHKNLGLFSKTSSFVLWQ